MYVSPRYSRKPFAPWKADFRLAVFYWMVGALWLAAALLWCIHEPSFTSAATAEVAALPLFFGLLHAESAHRRRYGSQVEKKWADKLLTAAPPNWAVEADVEIKNLGNIDLLIRFANGRRCPVEIKSWRNTRIIRRFEQALQQVQRQRDALQAQNGVLWLPEAKFRNAGYQRDIVVVQGNEQFLIECLNKLKYRYVVKFPQAPPQFLCSQLNELGFHQNSHGEIWAGWCNETMLDYIRAAVAAAGGTIDSL